MWSLTSFFRSEPANITEKSLKCFLFYSNISRCSIMKEEIFLWFCVFKQTYHVFLFIGSIVVGSSCSFSLKVMFGILGCHVPSLKSNDRSSHRWCFVEKGVLKNYRRLQAVHFFSLFQKTCLSYDSNFAVVRACSRIQITVHERCSDIVIIDFNSFMTEVLII